MNTKTIFLSEIDFKQSPKVRYAIESETVIEYAERYQSKVDMPPIVLFWDEEKKAMYLADGAHRCQACISLGRKSIEAIVHKGSYQKALEFALLANTHHGLPRSQDDKQQCVAVALNEWPKLSNLQIAKLCDVDDKTVAKYRSLMEKEGAIKKSATRTNSDGVERKATNTIRNSESKSVPKVVASDEPTKDNTGVKIPIKILPYWQRRDEIMVLLNTLKEVMGACKDAQEAKDLMFSEVNISGFLADLEKASANLRGALPHAVCPTCQGHPETQAKGCRMCYGKGLISEFRYKHCTTVETKQIREGK